MLLVMLLKLLEEIYLTIYEYFTIIFLVLLIIIKIRKVIGKITIINIQE